MDLENIFKTKTINAHYANRYLKFIKYCAAKNKECLDFSFYENHHILPKAKSMFPEFANLKRNPWNSVKLSPRQHFIAHWILWKACGKFMAYAFIGMKRSSKYQNRYFELNSKTYENLKIEAAKAQSERTISNETRHRMSEAQKKVEKRKCEYCGKSCSPVNYIRWHGDNCKVLTKINKHDIHPNVTVVTCPHCDKTGKLLGMKSNHFDNCPTIVDRTVKAEIVSCPHCGNTGKNIKSFRHYHFDNCKSLTGKPATIFRKVTETATCPHCGKTGNVRGIKAKHFDRCPSIAEKLPKITCPHCNKEGNDNNYFKSLHINKCEEKRNSSDGMYITPWGIFKSPIIASEHKNATVSKKLIIKYCKNSNVKLSNNYSVFYEYRGKTPLESGFNFIPNC